MTNISSKRLAIIGGGNIASFHVPALRAAGMNIVHCASSLNSKTIHQFAKNHNIEQIWSDPKKLAAAHHVWDGMVITSAVEPTLDLLEIAASTGKPVLVEKPVSSSPEKLAKFSSNSPSNIIVAYNRRHYSTIKKARDFIAEKKSVRATMTLPENVSQQMANPFYLVYENSVHGFDILNFVFGGVTVEHIATASANDPYFGRQAILKSKDGLLINLTMNWRAPANFTLSLDDADERLDLFPFEKYQLYKGMQVIEPSDEYPVRQYVPNQVDSGTVFDDMPSDIKPGFLGQSQEFSDLIDGRKPEIGANLTDAYQALVIAQKVVKNTKS